MEHAHLEVLPAAALGAGEERGGNELRGLDGSPLVADDAAHEIGFACF